MTDRDRWGAAPERQVWGPGARPPLSLPHLCPGCAEDAEDSVCLEAVGGLHLAGHAPRGWVHGQVQLSFPQSAALRSCGGDGSGVTPAGKVWPPPSASSVGGLGSSLSGPSRAQPRPAGLGGRPPVRATWTPKLSRWAWCLEMTSRDMTCEWGTHGRGQQHTADFYTRVGTVCQLGRAQDQRTCVEPPRPVSAFARWERTWPTGGVGAEKPPCCPRPSNPGNDREEGRVTMDGALQGSLCLGPTPAAGLRAASPTHRRLEDVGLSRAQRVRLHCHRLSRDPYGKGEATGA